MDKQTKREVLAFSAVMAVILIAALVIPPVVYYLSTWWAYWLPGRG